MSWDSYIDNLVAQCQDGNCDKGVIIGLDGGAPWTTPGHAKALAISPEEGAAIAKCFKAQDFSSMAANGVRIGGVKYQFLRCEENKAVYAKKKDNGSVSCQASKSAIVIAHCPEGGQQGNTNKGTSVIAEYLESLNM